MTVHEIIVSNLGPISSLEWKSLGGVNLIVGPNKSGKTMLMKALFSSLKTVELYRRGKENRTDKQILSDKLYWTYQVNNLSSIVRKGETTMSFTLNGFNGQSISFSLGKYAEKEANIEQNTFEPRNSNSVFIPAKEILSIRDIILESRDNQVFGFEEPYYDLAKALNRPQKGDNQDLRLKLYNMLGGRLEYISSQKEWQFRDQQRRLYEIGVLSEGVRKLSVFDLLLGNRYLDSNSVIIIDEVEANLHPSMIEAFLQVICDMSQFGVQFFVISNSCFVIKRLHAIAKQYNSSIPVLQLKYQ